MSEQKTTRIYMVRHGATQLSAEDRFAGAVDVELSEEGKFQAARLAVGGWVRNRSDGAVELHAEGRPQDVERLVAWARHGPRHAQVEGVEVTDAESQELRGFDITG